MSDCVIITTKKDKLLTDIITREFPKGTLLSITLDDLNDKLATIKKELFAKTGNFKNNWEATKVFLIEAIRDQFSQDNFIYSNLYGTFNSASREYTLDKFISLEIIPVLDKIEVSDETSEVDLEELKSLANKVSNHLFFKLEINDNRLENIFSLFSDITWFKTFYKQKLINRLFIGEGDYTSETSNIISTDKDYSIELLNYQTKLLKYILNSILDLKIQDKLAISDKLFTTISNIDFKDFKPSSEANKTKLFRLSKRQLKELFNILGTYFRTEKSDDSGKYTNNGEIEREFFGNYLILSNFDSYIELNLSEFVTVQESLKGAYNSSNKLGAKYIRHIASNVKLEFDDNVIVSASSLANKTVKSYITSLGIIGSPTATVLFNDFNLLLTYILNNIKNQTSSFRSDFSKFKEIIEAMEKLRVDGTLQASKAIKNTLRSIYYNIFSSENKSSLINLYESQTNIKYNLYSMIKGYINAMTSYNYISSEFDEKGDIIMHKLDSVTTSKNTGTVQARIANHILENNFESLITKLKEMGITISESFLEEDGKSKLNGFKILINLNLILILFSEKSLNVYVKGFPRTYLTENLLKDPNNRVSNTYKLNNYELAKFIKGNKELFSKLIKNILGIDVTREFQENLEMQPIPDLAGIFDLLTTALIGHKFLSISNTSNWDFKTKLEDKVAPLRNMVSKNIAFPTNILQWFNSGLGTILVGGLFRAYGAVKAIATVDGIINKNVEKTYIISNSGSKYPKFGATSAMNDDKVIMDRLASESGGTSAYDYNLFRTANILGESIINLETTNKDGEVKAVAKLTSGEQIYNDFVNRYLASNFTKYYFLPNTYSDKSRIWVKELNLSTNIGAIKTSSAKGLELTEKEIKLLGEIAEKSLNLLTVGQIAFLHRITMKNQFNCYILQLDTFTRLVVNLLHNKYKDSADKLERTKFEIKEGENYWTILSKLDGITEEELNSALLELQNNRLTTTELDSAIAELTSKRIADPSNKLKYDEEEKALKLRVLQVEMYPEVQYHIVDGKVLTGNVTLQYMEYMFNHLNTYNKRIEIEKALYAFSIKNDKVKFEIIDNQGRVNTKLQALMAQENYTQWVDSELNSIIPYKVKLAGKTEFVDSGSFTVEDIYKEGFEIELNPDLDKYFTLNNLVTDNYNAILFGFCFGHKGVKKPINWDVNKVNNLAYIRKIKEDEAARTNSLYKRGVIGGATIQPFILGLPNGIPPQYNIAIFEDIDCDVLNILATNTQEDLDALKATTLDGVIFINPMASILENNSIPTLALNSTKKPIGHFNRAKIGVAGLLKCATFSLSNDFIRASKEKINGELLFKRMTDVKWNNANIDVSIKAFKDYFYFDSETFKKIKIKSLIKKDQTEHTYILETLEISDTGQSGKPISTEVEINSNYDLWKVLGGAYSMTLDSTGNFILTEDSIQKVVNALIQKVEETYPLKDALIHYLVSHAAIKNGSANMNPNSKLYSTLTKGLVENTNTDLAKSEVLDDSVDFTTMLIDTDFLGILLTTDHELQDSSISEMTLVMSNLELKGYTHDYADLVYKNIGVVIAKLLTPYLANNLDTSVTSKLYSTLGKLLIQSYGDSRDAIGLTQSYLKAIKASLSSKEIPENALKIPFNDPNISTILQLGFTSNINYKVIKREFDGLAAVQHPSHDLVMLYSGKDGIAHKAEELLITSKSKKDYEDKLKNLDRDVESVGEVEIGDYVQIIENNKIIRLGYVDSYRDLSNLNKVNGKNSIGFRTILDYRNNKNIKIKILGSKGRNLRDQSVTFTYNDILYSVFELDASKLSWDLRSRLNASKSTSYENFIKEIESESELLVLIVEATERIRNYYPNINLKQLITNYLNSKSNATYKNIGDVLLELVQQDLSLLLNNLIIVPYNLREKNEELKPKLENNLELNPEELKTINKNLIEIEKNNEKIGLIRQKWENNVKPLHSNYIKLDKKRIKLVTATEAESKKLIQDIEKLELSIKSLSTLEDGITVEELEQENAKLHLKNTDIKTKLAEKLLAKQKESYVSVTTNHASGEMMIGKLQLRLFRLSKGDNLSTIMSLKSLFFLEKLNKELSNTLSDNLFDAYFTRSNGKQVYITTTEPVIGGTVEEFFPLYVYEDDHKVVVENSESTYGYLDTWKFYKVTDVNKRKLIVIYIAPEDYKKSIAILEKSKEFTSLLINIKSHNVRSLADLTAQSKLLLIDIKNSISKYKSVEELLKKAKEVESTDEVIILDTELRNVAIEPIDDIEIAALLKLNIDIRNTFSTNTALKMWVSFELAMNFIVARIPSQSMQSFTNLKIVEFINSDSNIIYLPHPILVYAGSDYDIDKAYCLGAHVNRNGIYTAWSDIFDYSSTRLFLLSNMLPIPMNFKENKDIVVDISKFKYNGLEIDIRKSIQTYKATNSLDKVNIKEEEFAKIVLFLNEVTNKKATIIYPETPEDRNLTKIAKEFIQEHFLTSLSDKDFGNAVKNKIYFTMFLSGADLNNYIALTTPITITSAKESAANSTLGLMSKLLSNFNLASRFIALFLNSIGQQAIGINAVGIKVQSSILNYFYEGLKNAKEISDVRKYTAYKFGKPVIVGLGIYSRLQEEFIGYNDLGEEIKLVLSNSIPNIDERLISSNDLLSYLKENYRNYPNIPEDVYISISILLSCATDNAKELVLEKINAAPELAGIYIYLLLTGVKFTDVTSFMTTKLISKILLKSRKNLYSSSTRYNNVKAAINYYSHGVELSYYIAPEYRNSLEKRFKNYLTSNEEARAKHSEKFKAYKAKYNIGKSTQLTIDLYVSTLNKEELEIFKNEFSKLLNNIEKSTDDDLEFKYDEENADLIEELNLILAAELEESEEYAKYSKSSEVNIPLVFNRFIKEAEERLEELAEIKSDLLSEDKIKDTLKTLKALSESAEEVTIMGRGESLNLGVPSKLMDKVALERRINNFVNSLFSKNRNSRTLVLDEDPEHPFIFDFVRFCTDESYASRAVEKYEEVKDTFNILAIWNTVPHFKLMMKAYGADNAILSTFSPVLYAALKDLVAYYVGENLFSTLNFAKLKIILRFLQDALAYKFLKTSHLSIAVKKYNKIYKRGVLVTGEEDLILDLSVSDNIGTFKYTFETYIFPELKKKYGNNKFLLGLYIDSYKDEYGNTVKYLKLPIKTDSNTLEQNDSLFALYLNAFNQIRLNNVESLYNKETGELKTIEDLFFIYNIITSSNRSGNSTLTKIFSNSVTNDDGIIKDYANFMNNPLFSVDEDMTRADLIVRLLDINLSYKNYKKIYSKELGRVICKWKDNIHENNTLDGAIKLPYLAGINREIDALLAFDILQKIIVLSELGNFEIKTKCDE